MVPSSVSPSLKNIRPLPHRSSLLGHDSMMMQHPSVSTSNAWTSPQPGPRPVHPPPGAVGTAGCRGWCRARVIAGFVARCDLCGSGCVSRHMRLLSRSGGCRAVSHASDRRPRCGCFEVSLHRECTQSALLGCCWPMAASPRPPRRAGLPCGTPQWAIIAIK